MTRVQRGQSRHKQPVHQDRHRRQANEPGGFTISASNSLFQGLDFLLDLRRAGERKLARLGRMEPALGPLEQLTPRAVSRAASLRAAVVWFTASRRAAPVRVPARAIANKWRRSSQFMACIFADRTGGETGFPAGLPG